MKEFKTLSDVLEYQANRIITKRLEPYDVIESAKKFYDVVDYTFTGRDKFEKLEIFLSELEKSTKASAGLYMKNVNKFYLLTAKENPQNLSNIEFLHKMLISTEYRFDEISQINQNGIIYSEDVEYSLEQIDMGKAEATFVII